MCFRCINQWLKSPSAYVTQGSGKSVLILVHLNIFACVCLCQLSHITSKVYLIFLKEIFLVKQEHVISSLNFRSVIFFE